MVIIIKYSSLLILLTSTPFLLNADSSYAPLLDFLSGKSKPSLGANNNNINVNDGTSTPWMMTGLSSPPPLPGNPPENGGNVGGGPFIPTPLGNTVQANNAAYQTLLSQPGMVPTDMLARNMVNGVVANPWSIIPYGEQVKYLRHYLANSLKENGNHDLYLPEDDDEHKSQNKKKRTSMLKRRKAVTSRLDKKKVLRQKQQNYDENEDKYKDDDYTGKKRPSRRVTRRNIKRRKQITTTVKDPENYEDNDENGESHDLNDENIFEHDARTVMSRKRSKGTLKTRHRRKSSKFQTDQINDENIPIQPSNATKAQKGKLDVDNDNRDDSNDYIDNRDNMQQSDNLDNDDADTGTGTDIDTDTDTDADIDPDENQHELRPTKREQLAFGLKEDTEQEAEEEHEFSTRPKDKHISPFFNKDLTNDSNFIANSGIEKGEKEKSKGKQDTTPYDNITEHIPDSMVPDDIPNDEDEEYYVEREESGKDVQDIDDDFQKNHPEKVSRIDDGSLRRRTKQRGTLKTKATTKYSKIINNNSKGKSGNIIDKVHKVWDKTASTIAEHNKPIKRRNSPRKWRKQSAMSLAMDMDNQQIDKYDIDDDDGHQEGLSVTAHSDGHNNDNNDEETWYQREKAKRAFKRPRKGLNLLGDDEDED